MQHERHVVDVDAAGGDVGGDEHRHRAVLERVERLGALRLGAAAVQRAGGDAGAAEVLGQAVGAVLGAHEAQRAALARGDRGDEVELGVEPHAETWWLIVSTDATAAASACTAGSVR